MAGADDAESKVTKDKLQQVLRDFELNDDVDKVVLMRISCQAFVLFFPRHSLTCIRIAYVCAGLAAGSKRDIRLKPECMLQVLGTSGRPSVNDLTLQDLTEVLTHQG